MPGPLQEDRQVQLLGLRKRGDVHVKGDNFMSSLPWSQIGNLLLQSNSLYIDLVFGD